MLQNPNIGLQIIKNLSERISWLTSRMSSLTVTNVEDRLYRVLAFFLQPMALDRCRWSPGGSTRQTMKPAPEKISPKGSVRVADSLQWR